MIQLILPWPPTANTYWRHPTHGPLAGRHLISLEGRAYRVVVQKAVLAQLRTAPRLAGRIHVVYTANPPDRRVRDLSNLLKATEDALTHAGVWLDDRQIDDLRVIRDVPLAGGRLFVHIHEEARGLAA